MYAHRLSLDEYCANEEEKEKEKKYQLYAVINHVGSLHSGH